MQNRLFVYVFTVINTIMEATAASVPNNRR